MLMFKILSILITGYRKRMKGVMIFIYLKNIPISALKKVLLK